MIEVGGSVGDLSAYKAEERRYSKIEHRLTNISEQSGDPILEVMRQNDLELVDVDRYLHALHAAERNKVIRERSADAGWDDEFRPASAMSNSEAQRIIAEASPALQRIGRMVRKLNNRPSGARCIQTMCRCAPRMTASCLAQRAEWEASR